jgi:hypothetical protein
MEFILAETSLQLVEQRKLQALQRLRSASAILQQANKHVGYVRGLVQESGLRVDIGAVSSYSIE